MEDGIETVRAELPALVCVMQNDFEPQRPKINGIISANKKEIKKLSMEDIGLSPEKTGLKGSPTYVSKAFRNITTHNAQKFKMNLADSVNLLEEKLKSFGNTNSANYSRILFMGAPEADIKNEIWNKIYKAMGMNAVLQIEYTPEGKTKSETYKVQPYQLIFDNGIWELWAYCLRQKHEGMRLFNLSRISSVGILELAGKFVLPKNYTFKNFVVGNFGCFNDENPQIYKIKFHKVSYAWLYSKDRIWGAKQTIEECDDGYILSFEASQFKPILRWILGWGKDAEPLEPAKLVKSWKDAVHEMAKKIESN